MASFRLHVPDEMFGGFQVVTVPEKEFIIASKITRSGSTMVAAQYRLGVAEKKHWATKAEYGKGVPMDLRMRRFSQKIIPIALHCSDGWSWHHRLAHPLRSWERRMLLRISGVPKKSAEDFVSWHRRAVGIGLHWFEERLSLDTVCVRLLRKIHCLSSTVAVLPLRLGDPPTVCHTSILFPSRGSALQKHSLVVEPQGLERGH